MKPKDFKAEIRYPIWDSDVDYLIDDLKPLFSEKDHPELSFYFHWTYSINTAVGLYHQSERKFIQKKEILKLPNGQELVFSFHEELPDCLMLENGNESCCIMEDIVVWPTKYYDKFMIFSSNKTNALYIIDSRGQIFQLPFVSKVNKYGDGVHVEMDREAGLYRVGETRVYFRSPEQRQIFSEKVQPNTNSAFNKELNRFTRANAHNYDGYLYLTAGSNKCGTLVSYFAENGMSCEVIPNIFVDDDTVNIRVPLTGENALREDVHFLCAKYDNNYSIYNIPLSHIGGGLTFSRKWKQKYYNLNFWLPKGKETMIYSVVNTLRFVFNTVDDYEVYKKSFSKIITLFERGKARLANNMFTSLLLLYPYDIGVNENYVLSRLSYINSLLCDEKIEVNSPSISDDCDDMFFDSDNHFDMELYARAYEESKRKYKAKMAEYESRVLSQISANGGKISKWANESNLFASVAKDYPDAIYQYRAEWLGLRTLDIYIPSLKIGIEYQGEQHYHPVDIFGGQEGYENTVKRDKQKAKLCQKNGVKLLLWKYDEVISKNQIERRINEIINV